MTRRHAFLLLLLPFLSVSSNSEALDGGGIDTVFAVRKNTNGNRVDYVPVDTSKPLSETLTAYLARRLKVRRI